MKTHKLISILVLGIAVGCAQAPRSPKLVEYQTKSAQVLGAYASAVSRGFKSTASKSSAKGALNYFDPSQQGLYNNWNQQNGGYILRDQLHQEVQDCKMQIQAIPPDCNNLGFMISSLARCLDRVISQQNPIYSYGYRQLDQPGQQYYTYLLDWRRPRPVQNFGLQDYQQLNPYAYTGWLPGNVTQQP